MRRWPPLLVVLAAGLAAGCLGEAPHDNPFDPLSERYRNEGAVSGRVTGIYPPFSGRAGVRVRFVRLDTAAAEHVVTTGADGAFEIGELPGGRYAVRAEGDGFRPAADTVEVAVGAAPARVDLRLDALPTVTAQAARTVHVERFFPEASVFRLEVEAEATDPDRAGDLAGAALVAPALGFRAPLAETAPGRFAAVLDAAALPGGRVQSLLGQPLVVEAVDLAGNVGVGPPLALVRVIEQTPLTASPQFPETPPNPPTLEWRPIALPFAFTYAVEVFLVDVAGGVNRVYERAGIASAETAHTVAAPLAPGQYQWAVWVVDEAGNRSRSKEAGFVVP